MQEVLKQAKWETSAPGTSTMNSQVLPFNYVIVSTKLHETGREGGNDMLFRLGVFILRCVWIRAKSTTFKSIVYFGLWLKLLWQMKLPHSRAGIVGIERSLEKKNMEMNRNISRAFEDLNRLMEKVCILNIGVSFDTGFIFFASLWYTEKSIRVCSVVHENHC